MLGGGQYFQQRDLVCDHGLQLCAKGVRNYVRLPPNTRHITLCFFKTQALETFEIGRRHVSLSTGRSLFFREIRAYCLRDHPNLDLLQSFRSELYRYYINGYKFIRIEY